MSNGRRPSEELRRLAAACSGGRVTLRRLTAEMTPRDHALLTLLLAVCFLHPVPMPGLSTALGLTITVAGWRMARRQGPWVPERFIDHPMPSASLGRVLSLFSRLLRRAEGFVRPRVRRVAEHPLVWRVNGALVAGCGLLILIPLPPPTNFPPAIALFLLSVGILESDSLFLALGWAAFALNVALFGLIFSLGWDGVQAVAAAVGR